MCAAMAARPSNSTAGGFRSLSELCADFRRRNNGNEAEGYSRAQGPPMERGSAGYPSANAGDPDSLHKVLAAARRAAPQGEDKAFRTGTLKKLFREKGFGFVTPDGGGSTADVFLHFSDLQTGGSEAAEKAMIAGLRIRYRGEVDHSTGKVRARDATILPVVGQRGNPFTVKYDACGNIVRDERAHANNGQSRSLVSDATKEEAKGQGRKKRDAGGGDCSRDTRLSSAEAVESSPSNATCSAAGNASPRAGAGSPAAARSYSRQELMAIYQRLKALFRLNGRPKDLRIRTLYMPWRSEDGKTHERSRANSNGEPSSPGGKKDRRRDASAEQGDDDDEEEDEALLDNEDANELRTSPGLYADPSPLSASGAGSSTQQTTPFLGASLEDADIDDLFAQPFKFASDDSEEDDDVKRRGGLGGVLMRLDRRRGSHGVEETEHSSTVAGPESDAMDMISSASDSGLGGAASGSVRGGAGSGSGI
eukprot:TRINITY_DN63272_c0_g1_i1.p1 TRINITY_DN63272_c0_g1~~TRINITY_DN63272_c0_g1_i1.p1  ORF type:complete len:479 (+),score=101.45 TRINITY_DN63272_c0_g1_i1:228-1664(+)